MKKSLRSLCAITTISLCAMGNLFAVDNNYFNNPLAELSQCILDSSNGSIINVI